MNQTRLLTRGAGLVPSFSTVLEPKKWEQTRLLICSSPPVPIGIHTPLSPFSSSLVDDDGAYGKWFSYSYLCSSAHCRRCRSSTRRRFL